MRLLLGVDLREEHPGTIIREAARWIAAMNAKLDLVYIDQTTRNMPFVLDGKLREDLERELQAYQNRDRRRLEELMEALPEDNRGRRDHRGRRSGGGPRPHARRLRRHRRGDARTLHARAPLHRQCGGAHHPQHEEKPVLVLRTGLPNNDD